MRHICTYIISDEEDVKMNAVVTLQAMSAILPYAPPTQMLHFPCINHFRLCLQNSEPKVHTCFHCICVRSIRRCDMFIFIAGGD